MIVKVNLHKMTFDFSTIIFSKNIVGGEELRNVEVSVEVDFKSYNNEYENTVFVNARVIAAVWELLLMEAHLMIKLH